jgi:hypothetical protein
MNADKFAVPANWALIYHEVQLRWRKKDWKNGIDQPPL